MQNNRELHHARGKIFVCTLQWTDIDYAIEHKLKLMRKHHQIFLNKLNNSNEQNNIRNNQTKKEREKRESQPKSAFT